MRELEDNEKVLVEWADKLIEDGTLLKDKEEIEDIKSIAWRMCAEEHINILNAEGSPDVYNKMFLKIRRTVPMIYDVETGLKALESFKQEFVA